MDTGRGRTKGFSPTGSSNSSLRRTPSRDGSPEFKGPSLRYIEVGDKKDWKSVNSVKDAGIPDITHVVGLACNCFACKSIQKAYAPKEEKTVYKPLFKNGDRVLLVGDRTGVVKWCGYVDGKVPSFTEYVGVQLDEPTGTNDGILNGKRYFQCLENHGVFVPVKDVLFVKGRNDIHFKSTKVTRVGRLPPVSTAGATSPEARGDGKLRRSVSGSSQRQRTLSATSATSARSTPTSPTARSPAEHRPVIPQRLKEAMERGEAMARERERLDDDIKETERSLSQMHASEEEIAEVRRRILEEAEMEMNSV